MKNPLSDREGGERINGFGYEKGGVGRFPEEGHDGGKVGSMFEEGLESFVA